MHKSESVLENKTHWDFEIQMDHLILVKRPDFVLTDKKTKEFAIMWILPFWQITE